MGILRTDIVSHSQLEATGGSLELDGVGDYLTFGAHSSFAPATADVTFELWFYLTDQSDFSKTGVFRREFGPTLKIEKNFKK